MKLFLYLSDFIVPFLILAIIVYGILMGTNVYDNFIKGARSGFLTVIKIMPTLIRADGCSRHSPCIRIS